MESGERKKHTNRVLSSLHQMPCNVSPNVITEANHIMRVTKSRQIPDIHANAFSTVKASKAVRNDYSSLFHPMRPFSLMNSLDPSCTKPRSTHGPLGLWAEYLCKCKRANRWKFLIDRRGAYVKRCDLDKRSNEITFNAKASSQKRRWLAIHKHGSITHEPRVYTTNK